MISAIDAEKVFDKFQHPFIIKSLSKINIEGMYINILWTIQDQTYTS